MPRPTSRVLALGAIALTFCLVVAACSNASTSSSAASAPGETDGVSAHEIDIGGIASATGPLANQYGPIFGAVQAYLDMVNAQGGVNGRKIKYVAQLDDQTNPSQNVADARALVQQYRVFAVVGVASPLFAGGPYLAQNNIPTFGWNVNPEWQDGNSLFGQMGDYIAFTSPGAALPWLAKQLGVTKVANIAYGVTQSAQCAQGNTNSFKKFGGQVVLNDTSLPFGATDVSGDITRIKDSGAQFIATCMDPTGNLVVSKGLQEQGIYSKVYQYWPNGYDSATLAANAPFMNGVFFSTSAGNVPYLHGYTKGMDQYLDAMAAHHLTVGDVTLAGWISADMFVKGLRMLGNNPTRSGLINAVNSMTDYTANNILVGIDWRYQHHSNGPYGCSAFVQVQGDKFVPVFGHGRNPFICWQSQAGSKGNTATTTDPVPFPHPSSFFNSPLPAPAPGTPITP
jgi:branched-chain amino acid transport system substrate-binding protein